MERVIAFADEFGNNSFNFKTQSSHFIIASIIINIKELDDVKEQLEKIRKKYFQTGEIKSQKVSKNHKRRIKILNELNKVNYSIYAVVINKKELYGDGFRYKKVFYKFLNGLLYKELYRTYPKLELIVDEHGSNDFMKSFKKYVEKNHIRDLFAGSDFNIIKSHNDLGVQLADFIAGTLGYIFDEQKKSEYSNDFMEIIEKKIISINHFPRKFEIINETDEYCQHSEYDETITTLALNRIYDFIDTTTGNNQKDKDRINFLKLLLLYHQSNHFKKYTTSNELIKHLNINREKEINKEYFGSQIIGYLRDKGILIGSSRDGYKIPTSVNDIKKFINHGRRIIMPMLRRIELSRKAILLATNNEYDILDEKEYRKLKKIIDNAS